MIINKHNQSSLYNKSVRDDDRSKFKKGSLGFRFQGAEGAPIPRGPSWSRILSNYWYVCTYILPKHHQYRSTSLIYQLRNQCLVLYLSYSYVNCSQDLQGIRVGNALLKSIFSPLKSKTYCRRRSIWLTMFSVLCYDQRSACREPHLNSQIF